MFGYNFTEEQICGWFTLGHFLAVGVFLTLLILSVYFSRKLTQKQAWWVLFGIAVSVTVFEIIKIVARACMGMHIDTYFPLRWCSLFLVAIWCVLSKNEKVKNFGGAFIVFACGLVAVFYIFCPTSLNKYPVYHIACLHSMFFHFVMGYSAVLLYMKKMYTPKINHFWYYFIYTSFATVVAIILNKYLDTNLMFMAVPNALPLMPLIYKFSKVLFMIVVWLAQCVALWWIGYLAHVVIVKVQNKRSELRLIKVEKSAVVEDKGGFIDNKISLVDEALISDDVSEITNKVEIQKPRKVAKKKVNKKTT